MTAQRRVQILVGLVFPLIATFAPVTTWSRHLFGRLAGGEVLWWVLIAAMLIYVVAIERLPLRSIGFRKPGVVDVVLAIVAGIVLFAGIPVIYGVIVPALHLKEQAQAANTMSAILATPFWFRFLLVTTAAAGEEILFRGYPIERIEELTRSAILAGVLTWAAFTYAHLASWGAVHLLVAGYGGVILTALYLWRRNLWANMIAHWIADGAGFLLLPVVMHQR